MIAETVNITAEAIEALAQEACWAYLTLQAHSLWHNDESTRLSPIYNAETVRDHAERGAFGMGRQPAPREYDAQRALGIVERLATTPAGCALWDEVRRTYGRPSPALTGLALAVIQEVRNG